MQIFNHADYAPTVTTNETRANLADLIGANSVSKRDGGKEVTAKEAEAQREAMKGSAAAAAAAAAANVERAAPGDLTRYHKVYVIFVRVNSKRVFVS